MSIKESQPPSMHRSIPYLSIAAVFIANFAILAYAVRSATNTSHSEESVSTGEIGGSATGNTSADANLTPRVVNVVDLPSEEKIGGSFLQHCAACHGLDGRGDGPAAEQLYPKPRDFLNSPLRFASLGDRASVVAALERSIRDGVPRSAMPGYGGVLSDSMIAGLAHHVLKVRESEGERLEIPPVDIGRRPPVTAQAQSRGEQLYRSLACITCHGERGHGDGQAARGLRDSLGRPVRPADLASGLFKTGQSPDVIAQTILKGVPGTPMAAHESVLIHLNQDGTRDASDAWALVAYIETLTAKHKTIRGEPSGAEITTIDALDDDMISNPNHVAWLGADPTIVGLQPLWQREEATTFVAVRAAKTDEYFAICIDWRDKSADFMRDHGVFPDGVAVMFAPTEEVPALPMGVEVEGHESEHSVNIWHWHADRQLAAANVNSTAEMIDLSGWFLFDMKATSRLPTIPKTGCPLNFESNAQDPMFQTASAVQNGLADPRLRKHAVLEANAQGFGTLALQEVAEQATSSTAVWSNGLWRVVMVRRRVTEDEHDVRLDGEGRLPIAFAVWNGSKGDHAGVKLVSGWHWLLVRP